MRAVGAAQAGRQATQACEQGREQEAQHVRAGSERGSGSEGDQRRRLSRAGSQAMGVTCAGGKGGWHSGSEGDQHRHQGALLGGQRARHGRKCHDWDRARAARVTSTGIRAGQGARRGRKCEGGEGGCSGSRAIATRV